MGDLPDALATSAHALGPQLEPALLEACDGRLSDIRWFKTDWQRSGAATAYATVAFEDGDREGVIKLPVGPGELRVTTGLCETAAPTPRVAFSGTSLGPHDLCWVVMERLPGDPLAAHIHAEVFEELATAAASFYAHAQEAWPEPKRRKEWDWEHLVATAHENAREHAIVEEQAWRSKLKEVKRQLPRIVHAWEQRSCATWCHGDLHPGNMMRRDDASPWGEAGPVLLDFAETHVGHWAEDAIYLERLFWARPDVIKEGKPVQAMRRARREAGLPTDEGDGLLLDLRRVLISATAPAYVDRDGHPAFLRAALEMLNTTLPVVLERV